MTDSQSDLDAAAQWEHIARLLAAATGVHSEPTAPDEWPSTKSIDASRTTDLRALELELRAREAWLACAPLAEKAIAERARISDGTDHAWMALSNRLAATRAADTIESKDHSMRRARTSVTPMGAHSRTTGSSWRPVVLTATALAAAMLLLVARQTATAPQASNSVANAEQWREYAAAPGERLVVTLADGSVATLRERSRLRTFAHDVSRGHTREVRLAGEAVFTVVHDANRPFRVVAGTLVVDDLGTRFAVRSAQGELTGRVLVTEGRVSVRADSAHRRPSVEMQAGNLAAVAPDGALMVSTVLHPENYLGWMHNRVAFHDEPLGQVVAELAVANAVTIVVEDSVLSTRRVTIDIPRRSLQETLSTLATVLDIDITTRGDTITLNARRAPRS